MMAENKQQDTQKPATEEIAPLSQETKRENFVADTTKPPPRVPEKDSKNERR